MSNAKYFKKHCQIAPTNRLLDLMQNCVYSIDLLFTYCVPNWVRSSDSHVGLGWCARVDYIMVNRNKQFQDNRCFCCIYRWRNR
ncbi:hypothetical protein HanPI659440_Chr17g0690271 [Helianthus annuus]|nr:hypothetical protein HanPI659440_Chr17g0690271 [Helianthus annuus]